MDRLKAQYWMQEALVEARKGASEKEIPIGAVLLWNDKVIGRGHNGSIGLHDPTAHAEIVALRQAARAVANYRMPGSVMIVTIEPCVMCMGALVQARVETLVYGAPDPKAGAVHSCFELADNPHLNHRIEVMAGVLADECGALVKEFFRNRRNVPG
mgnify:CR=1 FL=1